MTPEEFNHLPNACRGTCPTCDMSADWANEPDPCLGLLPGVAWACCGHGREQAAYVVFGDYPEQTYSNIADSVYVGGRAACLYFESLKGDS